MSRQAVSDPDVLYLQPDCCANDYEGQVWCDHVPQECEDGVPWTRYVRSEGPAGGFEKLRVEHAELLDTLRTFRAWLEALIDYDMLNEAPAERTGALFEVLDHLHAVAPEATR